MNIPQKINFTRKLENNDEAAKILFTKRNYW